jgi:hypothetical protein
VYRDAIVERADTAARCNRLALAAVLVSFVRTRDEAQSCNIAPATLSRQETLGPELNLHALQTGLPTEEAGSKSAASRDARERSAALGPSTTAALTHESKVPDPSPEHRPFH